MERSNKTELLKTIEQQKDQLTRYEKRLRDVVHAYKGLQTEKAALEDSVKALSQSSSYPTITSVEGGVNDNRDDKVQPETGSEKKAKENTESTEPVGMEDKSDLQQRVTTVTNTLTTVLQEKSKMEANYQAEKKKLRAEHEGVVHQLTEDKKKQEERMAKLEADITDWKSRVRISQHDREREQSDHALMLRELQKMLADERISKEQLEHRLEEKENDQSREYNRRVTDQYEKRIHQLSNELEVLRDRLRQSEEKSNKPSPMLLELQKQLAEMKTHHHMAVQGEQLRANEAEQELSQTAAQSEKRVSDLEAHLSELSDVVGNYERLRQKDQQAIQKLRDRVTQLDLENTALTKAAHHSDPFSTHDSQDNMENVHFIVEQIKQLKAQLKIANEKSMKPAENIEDLLHTDSEYGLEHSSEYKRLKSEHLTLKEEFERYKLRAQSVLKVKKDNLVNREEDLLKSKISELQERLRHVHHDTEEREQQSAERLQKLHNSISKMEQSHEHKLKMQELQHQAKIGELESEIKRHRERTISLLAEKDHEIQMLRSQTQDRYSTDVKPGRKSSRDRYMSESSESSEVMSPISPRDNVSPFSVRKSNAKEQESMVQLLAKTTLTAGFSGESSLLHFAEEQARKDLEITSLKKQKNGVESALRDLQHNVAMKEVRCQNDIERLEEQVRRMERNQSRESANLEYLKNVVYKYMICADVTGKTRMLNAISTILEFSPREKKEISHLLKAGWWK